MNQKLDTMKTTGDLQLSIRKRITRIKGHTAGEILKKNSIIAVLFAFIGLSAGLAAADNDDNDPMKSMISEKSPEWLFGRMNEWSAQMREKPVHMKMIVWTKRSLDKSIDFYSLDASADVEWIMVCQVENPSKYNYTILKRKGAQGGMEAYFPSLNRRVLYDNAAQIPPALQPELREFLLAEPLQSYNYAGIASFAWRLKVYEAGNGNYLLNIHVNPDEAVKLFGSRSLIFNIMVNFDGKELGRGMIINDGSDVVEQTVDFPGTVVDQQKIFAKYVVPALKAPLVKDKAFPEAEKEAAAGITGREKDFSHAWFDAGVSMTWGTILVSFFCIMIGVVFAPVAAACAQKGKYRRSVLMIAKGIIVLGPLLLAAVAVALLMGQPYYVWYPIFLCGILLSSIMPSCYYSLKSRYTASELKKMSINDME